MLTFGLPWQRVLLVCLASLAGFCLGIWATKISAKRHGIDARLRDILNLSGDLIRFTASRMAANMTIFMMISVLIFGGVCMLAGYAWRDHQLMQNSYTRTVDVKEELPSGSYRVREIEHGEPGREMFIYPCPERPVKWYSGMRLTISYEQLAECKLIRYHDAYVSNGKYATIKGEVP